MNSSLGWGSRGVAFYGRPSNPTDKRNHTFITLLVCRECFAISMRFIATPSQIADISELQVQSLLGNACISHRQRSSQASLIQSTRSLPPPSLCRVRNSEAPAWAAFRLISSSSSAFSMLKICLVDRFKRQPQASPEHHSVRTSSQILHS